LDATAADNPASAKPQAAKRILIPFAAKLVTLFIMLIFIGKGRREMDARVKCLGWLVLAVCPLVLAAQDEPAPKLDKRYGYVHEPILFPQKTPQETLQGVVRAIDSNKIDYLLAHLADPKFVDSRVAEYAAFQKGSEQAKAIFAFERLVRETALHFQEDPLLVKELRQYVKEGEWDVQEGVAIGTLKTASSRRVFLRKLEERWFLENKQQ
jgi:hypothetical protein